nr:CD3 gamma/delta [Ctenopharyngodon idella]
MERRLFWLFCLLTALRSVELADEPKDPEITISDMKLVCTNGDFHTQPKSLMEDADVIYTCVGNNTNKGCPESDECPKPKILVKVLSSDGLIQLNTPALLTVLFSDVIVTGMIGWAIYSICAQPRTRSSYQGNKASDRQNLITNNSAGDMYQPLNARSSEYSTLHGARKPKNSKQPLSP